ncbi:MAG: hypothetical protein DRI95_13315 [Bacteroidetes bacterium]|nr:MAG: hypothetical protein DRI95_13315 [Bacteroidota bacterium]
MKKKSFFKLIAVILLSSMLFSCEKENELNILNDQVEFTLNLSSDQLKNVLSAKECESLDNASMIVLTIETQTGESTIYTNSELNFYKMGGSYCSEKIALNVGAYKLGKFFLVDESNNVFLESPLEGSLQAQNVNHPLPITFEIIKDQAISVDVEVLCAIDLDPEDFGLASFWVDKIETFSFLIAVSELGKNEILAADLEMTSGSYTYLQSLAAIANNVVTIRDGFGNYNLQVSKTDYHNYVKSFTAAELKAYETIPLVIELKKKNVLHDPVLEIQFDEQLYGHNMHITSDGSFLYTINGGNEYYGSIKKYTMNGSFVESYPIQIDGRGLSYNEDDGFLYASLYRGHVVKIDDLEAGTWTELYHNKLQGLVNWEQASFALSPDGTKMYDFYLGILNVWNFQTGALIETITGLSCGLGNFGGNNCVAVDEDYIYTWNANTRTVYIYDLAGNFVRNLSLSHGDNGHSLSVFDGYLFVSKDSYFGVGTWYGYNIRRSIVKSAIIVKASNTEKGIKTYSKYPDTTTK